MSLFLTKQMLAPAYDYLRATKPFRSWHLPPSEEIFFGIIPNKDRCAHYFQRPDGRHAIELSTYWATRHILLLAAMAHEMCHLYLRLIKRDSRRNPHNAAFWRLADRVCKEHVEFDRRSF